MGYAGRLDEIFSRLREYYDGVEEARDKALKLSRDIIRLSGRLISHLVRGDREGAGSIAGELKGKASEFNETLKPYPHLYYTGFYNNTMGEYSEALIVYSIVERQGIPGPEDIGVSPTAFLLGIGDAVGELRRIIFEKLRRGELEECWELLSIMEEIQSRLSEMDYPEALIPGVRHKADSARRLVDSTKAFLIDLSNRAMLAELLEKFEDDLESGRRR